MRFAAAEVMMIERPYPLREAEFDRILRPSRLSAWIHAIGPATLLYWIQLLARRYFEQQIANTEYLTGSALLIILLVLVVCNKFVDNRRASLIKRIHEHYESHDPQEVTKT